ncbi:hypothetical protein [Nocardioides xinjiangensis]|uniref:hypothetical protein n=1 Tax=Nocardioides xinjiangensis TaxID=2817376 RepID=UPI001B31449E|nr:hypothetical protein [Nocardioides sp. SYSU D00778]
MARQLQNRVLDLVDDVLSTTVRREVAPDWLRRPGAVEWRQAWPTVQAIYRELTGGTLPDTMPPRERRSIDAVLSSPDGVERIVEVDEVQHFTPPRAKAFALYPPGTALAFDRVVWTERAAATARLPGGGFARPCPPLLPAAGGRHLQRAFRDALADLLPLQHGWAPTLRIGDFEVRTWLADDDAPERMEALLAAKGVG